MMQSVSAATDDDDPFASVKNEIKNRYELLPEEIQKAVMDDGYQNRLFEIAKAQKMTYEELGTLETETTMVLLGMTRPENYRDELQIQLKKNDAEIDTIVKAINEQVFAPIRSSLERVYAAKKEPEDFLSPLPASAPVAPAATAIPAARATPPQAPVAAPRPSVVAPIPPHMPTASISSAEKSVLEKTGVVLSDTPAPARPLQTEAIPDRSDLLKSIENPPRSQSSSMIAEKLKSAAPIMPSAKTTDYSVARTQTPPQAPVTPPTRASDPYREPIG